MSFSLDTTILLGHFEPSQGKTSGPHANHFLHARKRKRSILLQERWFVRCLVAVAISSTILLSPCSNCGRKILEDCDGAVPINAGIGDTDALRKCCRALGRDLLVTLADIGLDHDTDDGIFALSELITNYLGHLWLVPVVLVRVACFVSACLANAIFSDLFTDHESNQS